MRYSGVSCWDMSDAGLFVFVGFVRSGIMFWGFVVFLVGELFISDFIAFTGFIGFGLCGFGLGGEVVIGVGWNIRVAFQRGGVAVGLFVRFFGLSVVPVAFAELAGFGDMKRMAAGFPGPGAFSVGVAGFGEAAVGIGRDDGRFDEGFGEYLFELGQVGGRVDAEIIHEGLGRRIHERLAGHVFVAAGDDDELFFEELLDRVVAADAADGFYLPFSDGLFIGDDGQGLEGGGGKPFEELLAIELGNSLMIVFFREELPAAAAFADFEGIELGSIFLADAIDGRLDLFEGELFLHESERIVDKLRDLHGGQGLVAGEDQCFDMRDDVSDFHMQCFSGRCFLVRQILVLFAFGGFPALNQPWSAAAPLTISVSSVVMAA